MEAFTGGTITTGYQRSCVSNSKCNKVGSISFTGGTKKMGISCCDTDNCTPPLPQWPATSSQVNGLVCPSCVSKSWCEQQTNIQCTGSEQTCISQPSTSGSVMGCATSTLCDLADYSYMTQTNVETIFFYCFPATSSTATGTSCVHCSSESPTCTSSLSVIPANSKCASAYQISTKNGVKSYVVVRSWAPVSKCNIAGSMTVAGTKYLMGISCCDGDGCTPSIPDTTSTSEVSNGVQCKTCESSSSSTCEAYTTMTCTGQEAQCVSYAWTFTYGSTPSTSMIRGCGTKSLCDAQIISSTMHYMTLVNTFTCEYTINPSATTLSTTTLSTTTPRTTTPRNGGNSITAPSNGGVIFLLFSTLPPILILHQFN
ncbi:uncharacterized protein [Aquarana catesbeiana]|uniref:uncharacterized protein isoform X2 n=1 Tax=Aquarana catesbeiana TaxID=8400 RepID=UPI003CC9BD5E